MSSMFDRSSNQNSFVKKCPECGVPFTKQIIGKYPNSFDMVLPACGCRDKQIMEEREQEEKAERDKKYKLLLSKSNLPERCRNETFDIPTKSVYQEHGEDVIVHLEYEKFHRFLTNPAMFSIYCGIFMPGNPGTRKTTYACELAKKVMTLGKTVNYFQCAEIVTKKVFIYDNITTDFLILDDLGNNTIEKRDDLLWTLVNKRIDAKKFTIIITNFSDSHNREMHGDAFMDRLKLFMPVVMIGESSRKNGEELI